MIIDSNLVLIDHLSKNEIGDTGENMSRAVPLTSFLEPGRQGPIPIVVQLSDGLLDSETITFKLYQGDEYAEAEAGAETNTDGWEEIGTFTASGPMKKGCRIGWRFLPRSVTKQWLRLQVGDSNDSSDSNHKATDLTVFAAVVREDLFEYDKLLYINAGRNEWEAKEAALSTNKE
ncbi:MAG: hypothetical protein LUG23_09820 [Oscillospiraceae bacterium]|nr:hypothetical protein [Oscillospiraceae bacterium]